MSLRIDRGPPTAVAATREVPMPHLTKSRFLSGLQCHRRLWLATHAPDLASPRSDATEHILRMGTELGRAAHALFPGGLLIASPAFDHADAIQQTRAAMDDPSIPAIFEAAFEFAEVRIRVDILERLENGGWGLREVKSASSFKRDQHVTDLAIQLWGLEQLGVDVASVQLVHVNGAFVRSAAGGSGASFGGLASATAVMTAANPADERAAAAPIDWPAFFVCVELVETLAASSSGDLSADIDSMHATLALPNAPARDPGAFCNKPHRCPFWNHCTRDKPPAWFVEQSGHKPALKRRMIDAIGSDRPWTSGTLAQERTRLQPPVWALDFEAIAPAIPFYPGTRPYQPIVFQWSLDRWSGAEPSSETATSAGPRAGPRFEYDEIEHFEFLAPGDHDPRPEAARALVAALSRDAAPILVYSGYERRCLNDLAACSPELTPALNAIEHRLVDLLPIVRQHIYHPDFGVSFSIKTVAPALAPEIAYDDLPGVADGMSALATFVQIATGVLSGEEAQRARTGLLAYCARDTRALIGVARALLAST